MNSCIVSGFSSLTSGCLPILPRWYSSALGRVPERDHALLKGSWQNLGPGEQVGRAGGVWSLQVARVFGCAGPRFSGQTKNVDQREGLPGGTAAVQRESRSRDVWVVYLG